MTSRQLDLFEWGDRRSSALVLDWNVPFAERVISRIYEYDDDRPKPIYNATVIAMRARRRPEYPLTSSE